MASKKLYDYIVPRLIVEVEKEFSKTLNYKHEPSSFKEYGKYDKVLNKKRIAEFSLCFCACALKLGYSDFLISQDYKTIYCYNSCYYEEVGGIDFIEEVIKRVMVGLEFGRMYLVDAPTRVGKDVFRMMKNTDELIFKPNRNYIVFNNGVFLVEEGELRNFSKYFVTDIILNIDYVTRDELIRRCYDKCTLWDRTIGDIDKGVIPDNEMRKAFQMFCGSFLVDRSKLKIEYICYLYGSGSNGKSVIVSAIQNVFGDKYFSYYTPKQLLKDSDARNAIAGLRGKIANIVGDLDAKDVSGGDFKRLVSGEKMQGRENYGSSIAVAAPPLLCCTNTLPQSSDDTYGNHRRQLVIRTTKRQWTERDKDPYLAQKLSIIELRQYIFLWIYDGYKMIIANKGNFDFGERVIDMQKSLMEDNSTIRRWFMQSDYEIPEMGDQYVMLKLTRLYREYSKWCEDNLIQPKVGRELTKVLEDMGVETKIVHNSKSYMLKYKKVEIENSDNEEIKYERPDDSVWDNIESETEEITQIKDEENVYEEQEI